MIMENKVCVGLFYDIFIVYIKVSIVSYNTKVNIVL